VSVSELDVAWFRGKGVSVSRWLRFRVGEDRVRFVSAVPREWLR